MSSIVIYHIRMSGVFLKEVIFFIFHIFGLTLLKSLYAFIILFTVSNIIILFQSN